MALISINISAIACNSIGSWEDASQLLTITDKKLIAALLM